MPRIYKSAGPSVALRESQRGGDPGFVRAPDYTAQIDSLGRQSQSYLQSYQDQLSRNNQFQQNTLARAQRAQESNAQLALQQVQQRQQLDLRATEIQNNQSLARQRLQMEQQASVNQITADQQRIQAQQLTELGNSFIKFSETLWQKKAEQINYENEQLRLKGLNDYLSGNTGNSAADVAKVNQAEVLRTQGAIKAESAAIALEANGQKADATVVRTASPFYLRGQEEGQAMKAGLGYPTYLQTKVRQAIDSGTINILDPAFQAKLTQLIGIASNEYIKEQGLANINPGVLAKYFGYTKVQTEASILESYGNQAYKTVKEAQQTTADSQVYNSAAAILAMPREQWGAELQKLAAVTTAAYSMNPLQGHEMMLKQLIKHADLAGNFDLVDAFVAADRGDGNPFGSTPGLQEIYDKARTVFTQKQAALLEQQQAKNLEMVVSEYDAAVATGDIQAIRSQAEITVGKLLEIGTPDALAKARSIATAVPGEAPTMELALANARDKGYLDQFLRQNRDRMSAATFEKWSKYAEKTSKLKEPAYQQALNQTLAQIRFAAGEANETQQKLLPPHSRQALNDFVKLQQDKLKQFAQEWLAQNPGSNVKDFQDWLKGQEKSYTDPKQFVIDPSSDLPRGMSTMGNGAEFTGNPQVLRVTFGGRMREDYRSPKVQQGLATGQISPKAIQFANDLVFSQAQIQEAVTQYEKDGTWPNYMVQIASRSGRTVKSMVQTQARLYGGSGVIMDPGNFRLPPSPSGRGVSFDAVKNFGKSLGMSERGSIALATMVKDESGGDPFAVGDGGDSTGLMQWNRRYSPDRVRRLEDFARRNGKPVTDPGIQLNYAIYEMKNFYPSVWSVLTSRNPTNNQLWRATVEYLGFSPRVYAQRRESLETRLGDQSSIPNTELGDQLIAQLNNESGFEDVAGLQPLPMQRMFRQAGRPMAPERRARPNGPGYWALSKEDMKVSPALHQEVISRNQKIREAIDKWDPLAAENKQRLNNTNPNPRSKTVAPTNAQFKQALKPQIDAWFKEARKSGAFAYGRDEAPIEGKFDLSIFVDDKTRVALKRQVFLFLDKVKPAGEAKIYDMPDVFWTDLRRLGNDLLYEWNANRKRILQENTLDMIQMSRDVIRPIR